MRDKGLGKELLNKALSWCRTRVVPDSRDGCGHSVGDPNEQIALSPVRLG